MSPEQPQASFTKEEEYFYRRNRELIEKRRKEMEAERQAIEARSSKAAYWMKCPKCGGQMEEIDLAHLKVDKCTQCLGIYFDHGELDLLIDSKEPKGFLDAMKRLLK